MAQQATTYEKPLPLKTMDNAPYWDAADRHELALQHCEDCEKHFHPAGPACPRCGGQKIEWRIIGSDISGNVISYIISYRPFLPGFQNDCPLVIAVVQPEKAPEVTIMANILNEPPENIQVGMPVRMTWVAITEDRALPQWVAKAGV